jgi:hypothetical protein
VGPTATAWPEAEAKFAQNLSGTTSVAAGFMGSDLASSIDLGGSRVLWLFGDTFWATAAGQSRNQCRFIRNCIGLQTGSYDLSAATLTFYAGIEPDGTGTTPGSFFPEIGPADWAWISAGCMIDDKLLLIGSNVQPAAGDFPFRGAGARAYLVDNPADEPADWIMSPIPAPFTTSGPVPGIHVLDGGDGYIYGFGRGGDPWEGMYAVRWQRDEAKAGRLMNPQWWRGDVYGWDNTPQHGPRAARPPVAVLAPLIGAEGSVHQHSDSTWVTIQTPGIGATSLAYATSATLSGPFTTLTTFYTPPESGDPLYDIYAGKGHAEQTWSGKSADDVVCTYVVSIKAGGGGDIYNDTNVYFPRVVKVTGF